MTDITNRMQNYRECVRHIWNTHFRAEAEPRNDWDLRDEFYDAALILFRALVLRGLDVAETELLPDYRGDQQPLPFLRLVIETSSQVFVNRTGRSGYWDDPVTQLEKGDCELRFIQFFDCGTWGSGTSRSTGCASSPRRDIPILLAETPSSP